MVVVTTSPPRITRVRVSGPADCVSGFIRVLTDAAQIEGFSILSQSEPRQNRREPGFRVYLTVQFPDEDAATAAE